MLGLLALIGVTFATFSGQARINARNFSQSLIQPQDDELMDFALSQLINDTGDPRSVIRGHSLARDMYGGDANNNRFLALNPATGTPLGISSFATVSSSGNAAFVNITTNIPTNSAAFYGYQFTRWIMRVSYVPPAGTVQLPQIVDQTVEVLADNNSGLTHVFQVAVGPYPTNNEVTTTNPPTPPSVLPWTMSNVTAGTTTMGALDLLLYNNPGTFTLFSPVNASVNTSYANTGNYVFTLDSRWLNAFNGSGMGSLPPATVSINGTNVTVPLSTYGNFRYNGLSPSQIGMDEDYDACDLENWFLALQSADGQVIIPSFHRPGIVRHDLTNSVSDWDKSYRTSSQAAFVDSASRILRPVAADGNDPTAFRDLIPNATTGKIQYEVDNDGDGVTDSVWLDLGYPARRDSRGQLYKPMFSFMVIGLNGRIPLNTAGNLAGPGSTHADHLGNSVSEIDMTYALQNAFDGSTQDLSYAFTTPVLPPLTPSTNPDNSQVDNATRGTIPTLTPFGVDVRVTQLRNLLAGTRPQPNPATTSAANGDTNFVLIGGQPYFMPNGIADSSDPPLFDASGNAYVQRLTQPVAGRWGEAQSIPGVPFANPAYTTGGSAPQYVSVVTTNYANPVRAGYSLDIGDILNGVPRDAADDNYNSFDFYPTYDPLNTTGPVPYQRQGEVDDAELYDPAGAFLLPIDRMRRWLTPADINGTGSIRTFNTTTAGPAATNLGPDAWGRVSYYSYFRPPGAPGVINTNYTPPIAPVTTTAGLLPEIPLTTLGATYYPSLVALAAGTPAPFYTVGLPAGSPGSGTNPVVPGSTVPILTFPTYQPDVTNNPLHGFEFFKVPNLLSAYGGTNPNRNRPYNPQDFGGMPIDLNVGTNNIPTAYPTYDFSVDSKVHSDGLNEADEVNLYALNPLLDSPLGPSDLDWLYRQQDVDGATLTSRLAQLAPISFTNGLDGLRRRRLFAVDAWDTNNFVWANDNPGNVFPNNSTFFSDPTNPLALKTDPASGATVNTASASFSAYGAVNNLIVSTPSLAQRNKKINLNYPLPVSNDANEPVRQRWISDTYQLLKRILPPRAVDTPEELAQLSQFVINIVDFRDPDCAMTHFQNPDVIVSLGSIATAAGAATPTYTPPTLYFTNATIPTPTAPVPPVVTLPLDQFGMEYNPIAINEAMAYSFLRKTKNGTSYVATPTPRFFLELINTLTQTIAPAGSYVATNLDLGVANYDLVITNDDPASRPDPFMGQILPIINNSGTTTVFGPIPLLGTTAAGPTFTVTGTATTPPNVQLSAMTPGVASNAISSVPNPYLTTPTPYFYVIGSSGVPQTADTPPINAETNPITPFQALTPQFDPTDTTTTAGPSPTLTPNTPAPGALTLNNTTAASINGVTVGVPNAYQTAHPWLPVPGTATSAGSSTSKEAYYWICLRRPASPFFPPNPDPTGATGPYNPMIVVDSMRFPYIEGGGTVQSIDQTGNATNDKVTLGTNAIYSTQRAQPYRGGHAVRLPGDTTTFSATLNTAYGYSEQTSAPATNTGDVGYFSTGNPITANSTTNGIYHTFGKPNDQGEPWDWFMFHDRDFTSVAELMFVPGCPPGLFTKQFVELPPMVPSNTATSAGGAYANFPVPGVLTGGTVSFTFPPPNPPNAPTPASGGPPTAPNAYVYTTPTAGPVQPHTYPYLVDKFFYTGASLPPVSPTNLSAASYPGTDTAGSSVNTPSSDGWFKMFDFFEVPSQMIGAIGPVAQGTNFDWARQDVKPGLLNLNLIIDEEVFFSVLGKQSYNAGNGASSIDQFNQTLLNFAQLLPPPTSTTAGDTPTATSPGSASNLVPNVASAAAAYGGVTASYPFWALGQSGGVMTADWLHAQTGAGGTPTLGLGNKGLKAAFSQFLTLRHGGTGLLFGFNFERPFHSLSYPDIDYTVMRPATLPPSSSPPTSPPLATTTAAIAGAPYAYGSYAGDPGVRNPFLYPGTFTASLLAPPTGYTPATPFAGLPNVFMPEPIPARRLFQSPDAFGLTVLTPPTTITAPPVPAPLTAPPSNASDTGDPFINVAQTNGALPADTPAGSTTTYSLNEGYPTLVWSGNALAYPGSGASAGTGVARTNTFGNNSTTASGVTSLDYRQHPNWRLEMMQRVMNLTTVRTHQYAVWITIGFFEVIKAGDLGMLASSTPQLAYDIIGSEVGSVTGNSIRYRGFFLVDRTKLTGFNPGNTGSFRSAVVYRKVIQ